MRPKQFWMASGSGISEVHYLNAFDNALKECGLLNQNLVPVSSIPPAQMIDVIIRDGETWIPIEYAKSREESNYSLLKSNGKHYVKLPEEEIVYVIQAISKGSSEEYISAGIGVIWYWIDEAQGIIGALAMEEYGNMPEVDIKDAIEKRLLSMVKTRNANPLLENDKPLIKILTRSLKVPENHFGVVSVFVVFNPFTMIY